MMRLGDTDIEHPDIAEAQLTGYPRRKAERIVVPNCCMCGEPVSHANWFIEVDDELICWDCVLAHRHEPEDAYVECE